MDVMDELNIKDDSPRVHPEDAAYTSDSDRDKEDQDTDRELELSDDENYQIPGTSERDNTMFKSSSKFAGKFNTGVKGVIADAHSFESARRNKQRSQRTQENTNYVGYSPPQVDSSARLNGRGSSDESADEDDEDFVRTWRKNRMQELQSASTQTRRRSPSKRKYGTVEEVDAAGYLDAIEKVSSETVVVVTIYDEESQESQFVADCLFTLARRYLTTRFIRLHHTEAEMDTAATPAILAYKGGELFANIVRVVDEIPPGRSISSDSLELVLRRSNVLFKE